METLFKALADATRLRILGLLPTGEVCVCDIHESLKIPQPKASRHLAYLRRSGLVDTRRDGLWIHYRLGKLADPVMAAIVDAVRHALTPRRRGASRRRVGCRSERAAAVPTPGDVAGVSCWCAAAAAGRAVMTRSAGAYRRRARRRRGRHLRAARNSSTLPLDGLRDHLSTTLVARGPRADRSSAARRLEIYPDGALLRSVAIAADRQQSGLGRQLTESAIALARDRQVRAIYLSDDHRGGVFSEIRSRTDRASRGSAGRADLRRVHPRVPSSATVMRKTL